jgi:prolyl oligopeptidase
MIGEHQRDVLTSCECIDGKIVAYYLKNASDRMQVFDFSTPAKMLKEIDLPDIGSIVASHGKYDEKDFFFKFSSFTDPGSSWRVDMQTFEVEQINATKLLTGLDVS